MEKKYFKYFQNKQCEFYPCHKMKDEEDFNCIFCYCPLYALGDECGGHFVYTAKGIKNCSHCSIPHVKDNYDYIIKKLNQIVEMVKKETDDSQENN